MHFSGTDWFILGVGNCWTWSMDVINRLHCAWLSQFPKQPPFLLVCLSSYVLLIMLFKQPAITWPEESRGSLEFSREVTARLTAIFHQLTCIPPFEPKFKKWHIQTKTDTVQKALELIDLNQTFGNVLEWLEHCICLSWQRLKLCCSVCVVSQLLPENVLPENVILLQICDLNMLVQQYITIV